MDILMLIIVGLCAGWLAGKITNRSRPPLENMVIGIIGAAIGGMLFRSAGVNSFGLIGSLISATIGSLVLIFGIQALR